MIKIVHVITGLDTGGAEMLLYNLLRTSDASVFQHEVISLTDIGLIGQKIQSNGFNVQALGMKRTLGNIGKASKLAKHLSVRSPDLVHTWLYHSNVIGGIVAKIACNSRVIWSLHSGELVRGVKQFTRWTIKFGAKLSYFVPKTIIGTSEDTRLVHVRAGYDPQKIVVINNGIDTSVFKPDFTARFSVRRELGVPEDTFLIGLIARFDPQKDHHNFVLAASKLHRKFPTVHFLLIGAGITTENTTLMKWIQTESMQQVFHLLGRREDTSRIHASLDVEVLTSYGETSPLAIIEAMACGVPCVVTNVGDLPRIIGDTGICVPPRDHIEIASALEKMVLLPSSARQSLGIKARQRIQEHYELSNMTHKYETLWVSLVNHRR